PWMAFFSQNRVKAAIAPSRGIIVYKSVTSNTINNVVELR
ncbi:unnamed protein product, partial [Rotaria sp. Silwood2]